MITAKVIINGKPLDDYTPEELRQIIINQQAYIARQSEIWQEELSNLRRFVNDNNDRPTIAFVWIFVAYVVGLISGCAL